MVRLRFQELDLELEPELHDYAKIFLFRTEKMMIHLNFLVFVTAVLVTYIN